jgi:hypothetical protein
LFGLFHRHRRHGQLENGIPPDTCERFLVSGLGAPNPHQVAASFLPTPNLNEGLDRYKRRVTDNGFARGPHRFPQRGIM